MNKRKAKKNQKKIVFPVSKNIDLLTLGEEERNQALDAYSKYVQKHCHYKHYRDAETLLKKHYMTFPISSS